MDMYKIEDNFTDSVSLLRKEKRRRSRADLPANEKLENELWLFLHKIGFNRLNCEGECTVTVGKDPANQIEKKIDIVAESEDSILFIECSTQKTIEKKIKEWISDVKPLRNYIKIEKKNIGFAFFTDQEVSKSFNTILSEAGIKLITSKRLQYFDELMSNYKNLAYYQLLGYLFRDKPLLSIPKESFKIPAIKAKYSSNRYCYIFSIQPSKIIPLAVVLHRKMESHENISMNYQRLVRRKKINSIKEYIEKEGGVFPTNIIISFDSKKKNYFKVKDKISGIQFGEFELPNRYQSITVIDGQHRLFAYDKLEEGHSHFIYVIAFEKLKIEDQIKMFVDINEKQTSVSSSLMWDIYPQILVETDIRSRISSLAKKLNEKEGALHGVINYDSAPYSKQQPKITLESICSAIKSSKLIASKIDGISLQLQIDNDNDFYSYNILKSFYDSVSELSPEQWNRTAKSMNILRSNLGVGALIYLCAEILDYLHKKNNLIPLKKNKFEKIKQDFKKLLNPVIDLVDTKTTKEEIKAFKRTGIAGLKEMFLDFVKEINKLYKDFGNHLIEKQEEILLDKLLQKLKEDDEHFDIEAKEAIFVNTKKSKETGKLEKNTDQDIPKILKAIPAFANGKYGGHLVVGIKDKTHEIVGIDDTDLTLKKDYENFKRTLAQKIKNEITNLSTPPEIKKCVKNNKTVVIIEVERNPKIMFEEQRLAALKVDNNIYIRNNGISEALEAGKTKDYCEKVLETIAKEDIDKDKQNNKEE